MTTKNEDRFLAAAGPLVLAFFEAGGGSEDGDAWEWLEAIDQVALKWVPQCEFARAQDLADILTARYYASKPESALTEGKQKNLFWLSVHHSNSRWGYSFTSCPRPTNDCLILVSREIEGSRDKSLDPSISRGASEASLLLDDECIPPLYVHESRLVPRRLDDLTRIPAVHTTASRFPGARLIHPLVGYLYATHRDAHLTPAAAMTAAYID